MFDKANGLIWDYVGTKYLTLFGSEKYNSMFNRIKFLIILKSKNPVDSEDDLPLKSIDYA